MLGIATAAIIIYALLLCPALLTMVVAIAVVAVIGVAVGLGLRRRKST